MDKVAFSAAAAFFRSRERYGRLGNMTCGFPIALNGLWFSGPEALYQALKYPNSPHLQRHIADARNGIAAKHIAYGREGKQHGIAERSDWYDIRSDAMRYTLAQKLVCHPEKFGEALEETANLIIVEKSFRDDFWGAHPENGFFVGQNTLGHLLTELRDRRRTYQENADMAAYEFIRSVEIAKLVINREPVPNLIPAVV